MKTSVARVLGWAAFAGVLFSSAGFSKENEKVSPFHQFTMKSLSGKEVSFSKYQGKVVLLVNVASQCGYTPQYEGLQALHKRFAKDGLVVLGVPSNDFGRQEPGTDGEIAEFCKKNYGVEFDMLSKVVVKGEGQCPLYKFLTDKETNSASPGPISWNFEKFLVGRDGKIVGRFKSDVSPESPKLVDAIEAALAKK